MLVFLKLGGSMITDKTKPDTPRMNFIHSAAREIASALVTNPSLQLLIGHGSGSFGHTAAERYGTIHGVIRPEQWRGFAAVSVAAARLNHIIMEALYSAGIPTMRFQPSASVTVRDNDILSMMDAPIKTALDMGLVPLIFGDVAFDQTRGGTILSTEDLFSYLAPRLMPQVILLAGEVKGVYDENETLVPWITPESLVHVRSALSGSRGVDVTGGMLAKVESMLALCESVPGLSIRIFSGEIPGIITKALVSPDNFDEGTLISS